MFTATSADLWKISIALTSFAIAQTKNPWIYFSFILPLLVSYSSPEPDRYSFPVANVTLNNSSDHSLKASERTLQESKSVLFFFSPVFLLNNSLQPLMHLYM